jgi:hypothetical protein
LLISWKVPLAGFLTVLLAAAGVVGTMLVALGVLGRPAAMALVFPIGFDIAVRGLQWDNSMALVSAIFLMLFGTGIGSLWAIEERFFKERLGGRRVGVDGHR